MEHHIKKIVLIGPESSGKTTLCELLAAHYQTPCVKEYAREYLQTNGKEYSFSDIKKIGQGQLENEEKVISELMKTALIQKKPQPLFIDTDFHVLKVWSEIVFNQCDNWLLNTISSRKYDLYLLCEPDIPWVADEFRESPDLNARLKIFQHYKEIMINQQVTWSIINGDYESRLLQARKVVDLLLQ